MTKNDVLNAIRGRRSVLRFEPKPVSDDEVEAILEAGRWAPSFANSQPWTFVVVRDEETKAKLGALVERLAFARRGQVALTGKGVGDAPVLIAVVVDPVKDPGHWIEAGAVATQNMALMAHSLGLASYWAGLRGRAEAEVKRILGIPRGMRVVALLPIGRPAYTPREVERVPLSEIVRRDRFGG
ncbi:MAG: nitroreductase family protein [Candidatus Bipolaricaulis anaerobius]|nr:nitroreductase family protein [Candidatus Bipolaricaulis anaerobius]